MNGLVSSPAPAPDPADATVIADDWFPAIDVADVRKTIRLGEGVVTHDRLVAAIEEGMLHGFRELAEWRTARVLEGSANLAAVTLLTLNGRNRAVLLWERIVRYYAAAELADDHRDISATERGLDLAREKDESADGYRQKASAAVADLRSIASAETVSRNRVALI